MEERIGEAYELGEALTVVGQRLRIGDIAPEFALDRLEGAAIQPVRLSDTAGRVRLLHVVNSLDTPVCHVGTHRWETLRTDLPPETIVYTVSMDLPFAQGRWASGEGIEHSLLSSHRDTRFGEEYGVLLKEWRLLQRAVFVIDRAGRVAHTEYVADQMAEPDYAAAADAVRASS